jgi:hypothetical protein
MRNDELFNPGCPDDHAKRLVNSYVMRGLTDDHGSYSSNRLLAKQHVVYLEWLTEVHKSTTNFECGFYEWLSRKCDAAFVFKPGDLVKHDGHYCVVVRRCPYGVGWVNSWRLHDRLIRQAIWPMPLDMVELKDPTGHTYVVNALAGNIEPADIPPEVFELACGKAKNCPMMKGDTE